ncbi:hypothetical protein [Avibacterium paragallinarum]|uniref:Uncharacterized protein n=1 Tax=Avibacterium paragallinarum TaxID=728 RepID=A0A8B3TJD7_AVIPA|nr:hypothetical protein [Avibacterium paragallinarum]RZN51761.1 hypothetical protein EIG78_12815 [Avibacterium paragallinarum]RZN60588.1 hypothetical protein EIG79_03070 [Avibacterium paragallinarum]TID21126.1 hypothetical protein JO83_07790 [Avibacterium paragallinarum]
MHPELIVCAAIKFIERNQKEINLGRKGTELIIPMVRHYSPDGRDVIEILENKELAEVEQGFLTNKSRFVDRKEALKIAKDNNQIKFDIGYEPDKLYSEMLY